MTTYKFLPVLIVSTVLAGSALAQTTGTGAGKQNANQAIEQQIEAKTGAVTERNTIGEAAATALSEQKPIGSGAVVEWVGKPIAAIDGTKVGTVSEVKTNERGAVMEVYAKVGGLFGLFAREISIPAARIILERDGVLVAEMSAEEIRNAPPVSG